MNADDNGKVTVTDSSSVNTMEQARKSKRDAKHESEMMKTLGINDKTQPRPKATTLLGLAESLVNRER